MQIQVHWYRFSLPKPPPATLSDTELARVVEAHQLDRAHIEFITFAGRRHLLRRAQREIFLTDLRRPV